MNTRHTSFWFSQYRENGPLCGESLSTSLEKENKGHIHNWKREVCCVCVCVHVCMHTGSLYSYLVFWLVPATRFCPDSFRILEFSSQCFMSKI